MDFLILRAAAGRVSKDKDITGGALVLRDHSGLFSMRPTAIGRLYSSPLN